MLHDVKFFLGPFVAVLLQFESYGGILPFTPMQVQMMPKAW
jgi:hypothetical protein